MEEVTRNEGEMQQVVADKKKKAFKRPSDKVLEEVFNSCGGIVTAVAQKLKVDRATVQRWLADDPYLQKVREDARDRIVDMAEANLVKMLQNGKNEYQQMVSTFFTLKTIGKNRGYVERSEVDERKQIVVTVREE